MPFPGASWWKALDAFTASSYVVRVRVTRRACRRLMSGSDPANPLEQLWVRATADADTAERVASAAEHVEAGLRTGLTRWIGREGYQGLLLRALDEVRVRHPWMNGLRCEPGRLNGLAAAAEGQTAAAVSAGMLALIAALARVLGRITGDEMATRLMEHSWAAGQPEAGGRATPATEKGTHDA